MGVTAQQENTNSLLGMREIRFIHFESAKAETALEALKGAPRNPASKAVESC
ncbi:hypothetical protein [Mesorhizobium sp.]|uniref:hypothetical protein n=1 Tax=Mesorhizobium sp. TaxID=1871066 RepID=UPI0025C3F293|nr:hypothetical protein [Mesorhizobium sp.]